MWNKLVFIFIAFFILGSCGTSSHNGFNKRKYRKGWFVHNKGNLPSTKAQSKNQKFKSGKGDIHPQQGYLLPKTKRTKASSNGEEKENIVEKNSQDQQKNNTTKNSKRIQKKNKKVIDHKSKKKPLIAVVKKMKKTSFEEIEDDVTSFPNNGIGYLSLLALAVFIPFVYRAVKTTNDNEEERPSEYVHNGWAIAFGIIGLTILLLGLMIFFLILLFGILWDGFSMNVILAVIGVLILAYLAIMTFILFVLKLSRKKGDDSRIFSKKTFKIFAIIFGGIVVVISLVLLITFFAG